MFGIANRKLARGLRSAAFAVGAAVFASAPALGAVVFQDTFGSSTLNPANASYPTPTATSTGYDVASTKNATSTIASGNLRNSIPATTSGFVETQALFAAPANAVVLGSVGDFIEYTLTFKDTAGILSDGAGSSSYLYMGLYNSHGSTPTSGLQTSGLTATAGSAFATGNAANFEGFAGRIAFNAGTSQVITRPLQSGAGTTSANQDLVANNVGGGAYNNPAGTSLAGSLASTVALTAGSTYTADYKIQLTAAGTESITYSLYTGTDTNGTLLSTQTGNATGANFLTSTFDALAFGYRYSGTSALSTMDVASVTVLTGVGTVPEPASLGLLSLCGMALIRRRARA